MMDTVGNKLARKEIAMIKVCGPQHGLPSDPIGPFRLTVQLGYLATFRIAYNYAQARTLRFADGPSEQCIATRSVKWNWRSTKCRASSDNLERGASNVRIPWIKSYPDGIRYDREFNADAHWQI